MSDRVFFDTNVLIYAVSRGDARAEKADELLAAGGTVSVQVLNEFVAVVRRKLGMTWEDVRQALDAIRALCPPPVPMTVEMHDAAITIAMRYGFRIYDALIVAAALEAGCATLYSEDMQDGQIIEAGADLRRLSVRNPFANP